MLWCAWCSYTRGRVECSHGGVLDGYTRGRGGGVIVSSAYQDLSTWGYNVLQKLTKSNHWILPIFSLRTGPEQHGSRFLKSLVFFSKHGGLGHARPPRQLPFLVCLATSSIVHPALFAGADAEFEVSSYDPLPTLSRPFFQTGLLPTSPPTRWLSPVAQYVLGTRGSRHTAEGNTRVSLDFALLKQSSPRLGC